MTRFANSRAFAPVLAFFAALIVAFASVGSNWYLDERSEQRENERRALEQMREYRQAQRLVDSELERIGIALNALLLRGTVPDRPGGRRDPSRFLQTQEWHTYKEVLAAAIDSDDFWAQLQAMYSWVENQRFWLEQREGGERLHPREVRIVDRMRGEILEIRNAWPSASAVVD